MQNQIPGEKYSYTPAVGELEAQTPKIQGGDTDWNAIFGRRDANRRAEEAKREREAAIKASKEKEKGELISALSVDWDSEDDKAATNAWNSVRNAVMKEGANLYSAEVQNALKSYESSRLDSKEKQKLKLEAQKKISGQPEGKYYNTENIYDAEEVTTKVDGKDVTLNINEIKTPEEYFLFNAARKEQIGKMRETFNVPAYVNAQKDEIQQKIKTEIPLASGQTQVTEKTIDDVVNRNLDLYYDARAEVAPQMEYNLKKMQEEQPDLVINGVKVSDMKDGKELFRNTYAPVLKMENKDLQGTPKTSGSYGSGWVETPKGAYGFSEKGAQRPFQQDDAWWKAQYEQTKKNLPNYGKTFDQFKEAVESREDYPKTSNPTVMIYGKGEGKNVELDFMKDGKNILAAPVRFEEVKPGEWEITVRQLTKGAKDGKPAVYDYFNIPIQDNEYSNLKQVQLTYGDVDPSKFKSTKPSTQPAKAGTQKTAKKYKYVGDGFTKGITITEEQKAKFNIPDNELEEIK